MNILNLFKQSFLAKTIIILAVMLTGGANFAWGDAIITGNSINTEEWNTTWGKTYMSSWNTSNNEYCQANTWAYYVLVSKSKFNMSSKKIVISARGIGDSAEITIKTSTTGNTANDTFTNHVSYTKDVLGTSNSNNFKSFEINDISDNCYILIFAKGVQIQSMSIETKTNPEISIFPNESASFGNLSADYSKTYTISNLGAGSMTVNFTNTNTTDFSVLNSSDEVITSLSDIVNGSPQTFKIRFNYNSENLGDKSATIKVIPTYDENDSIKIVASANARSNNDPELSVSPNENFDFGTVTANASKTYTVTNTGTGTMNVTITSSNTDYFKLSSNDFTEETTTIESIAAGESAEFTVNFNYTCAIANFGSHNSTITVTPSYNSEDAVSWDITANATADVVIDETKATTWSSGTKNSVWVKYQPQNGWNTIIIPFSTYTNTYLASIFGSGAKAYLLNSFSDKGVISFKYSNYIGANVPCLVYIENAPDNSSGVLLTGPYVFNATPGIVSKSNSNSETVTFKGTFAPIAAPGMEGKYGVTTAGKLGKGNSSASIKGYRAYIEVDGATSSRLSIVFDDEENQTTDLGFVKLIDKDAKDVFNLQGQKVKKATKGIYIVNGRKVIIK